MAEVCVVGAGPAGSVFAARMAELGHQVRPDRTGDRFPQQPPRQVPEPRRRPLLKSARLPETALDARGVHARAQRLDQLGGRTATDAKTRASRD